MRYLFVVFIVCIFSLSVYAEPIRSINEYKIEQLQKEIDNINNEIKELKNDTDDTKEKNIENTKNNENLDKRIGDISGSVDRFGIIAGILGLLITIGLAISGWLGYRKTKDDAMKEAQNTTKEWIEKDGKTQLNEIVQELQKKSEEQFSRLVDEKTSEFNTLRKAFEQKHNDQINNHEKAFKQLKEQYTSEEKDAIEQEAKISKVKTTKTFDDYWNIILQHFSDKKFDDSLSIIDEALKLTYLTNHQKGEFYFAKGWLYKEKKDNENAKKYYLLAIESGNNSALNNLGLLYSELKEYENAKKYYLLAIETGNTLALFNLGLLYSELKEYENAKKYYLLAIDSGNNDALFNLGNLYNDLKEYENAKKYYLLAIESGDNKALNNLAYLYFTIANEPKEALSLVQKSYDTKKNYANTHTLATILLWNEEFAKSYEKFDECLKYDEALEKIDDITEYLNLLITKGQHHKAKEYFENETHQLKDRAKPIWYALMTLMEEELPDEIKKMGSELQTSVDDILKTIDELKGKYKI